MTALPVASSFSFPTPPHGLGMGHVSGFPRDKLKQFFQIPVMELIVPIGKFHSNSNRVVMTSSEPAVAESAPAEAGQESGSKWPALAHLLGDHAEAEAMTDHASLLRQIHTEARPYVEQLVELNVAFTGFRKLATDNGLDWGQIKALLRAEIEDGLAGGSEKVDRIIQKAEFAGEYAALLGLGSANMNECNSNSEPDRNKGRTWTNEGLTDKVSIEPHDPSTGELIEEPDAQHEATIETTLPMPVATSPASSQGPCAQGSGAVQDRCESTAPPISAPPIADQGLDSIGIPQPELLSSPAIDLEIPAFLRRTA